MRKFLTTILILFFTLHVYTQAPVDCFYPGKGNTQIALSASFEKYSTFYYGNGDTQDWADDYKTNSYSLYGQYGISEKFAAVVSIPFIMVNTMNYNNEDVHRKSLQDIALFMKYRALEKTKGNWTYTLSPSLGFSTPMTNYTVDFYGVGQGATAVDARLGFMLRNNKGYFAEIQAAGLVRFDPAPSGFAANAKIGYFNARWYADVYYTMQNISGGADLPDPSSFEELGVSYNRAGATVAYNIGEKVGIYIGGASVLSGLNIGKSNRVSGGFVLRF